MQTVYKIFVKTAELNCKKHYERK